MKTDVSFLVEYGQAIRDGVYESFMEVAKVTDLKELKEAGFKVDEYHLDSAGWDRLYVLLKDNTIKMSCTLTVKLKQGGGVEPIVKVLTSLETQALLKRLQRAAKQAAKNKKDN